MRTRFRALAAGCGIAIAVFGSAAPAFAAGTEASSGAKAAGEGELNFANHAAEECHEKLATGSTIDDCQKAPSPLKPETNEIIWGSAAFFVLLIAMWKWGVPAVKKMEEARAERISSDLDGAFKAKADAEGALAEYKAQIANASAEAAGIVDDARQQAEVVKRDLITRAEQEAAVVRAKANDDARLASERAFADLRQQVAAMSVELAGKIVEQNLDPATQQSLIDSYISSVGSN